MAGPCIPQKGRHGGQNRSGTTGLRAFDPISSGALVDLVPPWFTHVPILDKTDSYFLQGTFDPWDLMAIAMGALAAYVAIQKTERQTVSRD